MKVPDSFITLHYRWADIMVEQNSIICWEKETFHHIDLNSGYFFEKGMANNTVIN